VGGEASLKKFFAPLEKCVGYSLNILDIVQKIWAPLRNFFSPPGVPSWLRACLLSLFSIRVFSCPDINSSKLAVFRHTTFEFNFTIYGDYSCHDVNSS